MVMANNDNEATDELKKAEVMLRLLEITKNRANETLELLNDTIGEIPDDINATYQEALSLYDQSAKAFENGNYSGCIALGRMAMTKFELCLKNACKLLVGEVGEAMAWKGLTVALNRLRSFIDRVKALRDKVYSEFEELRDNITNSVDPLIEAANDLANEAEELIKEGNYTGASKAIGEGHAKAAHALAALNKLLKSRAVAIGRAKRYIERNFEKFGERVRQKTRQMERTRARSILNKLDQIADKLEKLKGFTSDEEVKEKLRERLTEIQNMLDELLKELGG
jgi:mevalonate kinase